MNLLLALNFLTSEGLAQTCKEACISHSEYPKACSQYSDQDMCSTVHQQCLQQCSVVEVTASEMDGTLFSDIQIGLVEGAMKACPDYFKALTRIHRSDLRACHVSSLKEYPEVAGRVVVDIDLDRGSVFRAQIKENLTADNALSSCVEKEIESWQLPFSCTDLISITLEFQPMAESYAKGDTDEDGVPNYQDYFPMDANESADGDGDGIGDKADQHPEEMREASDNDSGSPGDKQREDKQLEAELDAIDKDFQMLQDMSNAERMKRKQYYREISESLQGKELIYRSNAALKTEWEALTSQRVAMKESRNTWKMQRYLIELDRIGEEIKKGHTLVVTGEEYDSIPIEHRSRTVHLYPAQQINTDLFSIKKEVGARIDWWESGSSEIGIRLEGGINSGAALHFNSGAKLRRDYDLFLGTYLLTPELTFSTEVAPWLINRPDVLLRAGSSFDGVPYIGAAFRYEFRNFLSITATCDFASLDVMPRPGASVGFKRIKKL